MPESIGLVARFVLSLLFTAAAVDAAARAKTDTVQLVNGNRINGEIKAMENGLLRYGTDSMGTVNIEWDDVTTLDSNHFFRLRTLARVRLFGALGESEIDGHVLIVHAGGVEDIPVQNIVEIAPIESTLSDRLDSVVNFGYSDIKASGASTTEFGLRVTYDDEFSQNALDVRSIIAESDNETNTSNRIDLTRKRLWENPVYFNFYRAGWESNDQLAVDGRLVTSYGIGRRIFDDNRNKLWVIGGLQLVSEEDSQGEGTESIEGLLAASYRTWNFSSPDLELVTGLRLYPGITESGRLRADADITLSWEIIGDLDLNLTATSSYDNETNQDGDDYDYTITTGLAWEF